MSQKDPVPTFTKAEGEGFFLSANGYTGFRSIHGSFYNSLQYTRVFVITGGPGTGKSRLMHRIAKAAEAKGCHVTYIRCSSDPDSLDGTVLEKGENRIALLDGTAPHVRVIDYPGVIDEWIDLTTCWDAGKLAKAREEICTLMDEKKAAYARAYRFLRIAGEADRAREAELKSALLEDKLSRAIGRELRFLHPSATSSEECRFLSACSMQGYRYLSPFPDESTAVAISDEYGGGHLFLDALCALLRKEGRYRFIRFPSCYTDEKTESIYLPQNKTVYSTVLSIKKSRGINIKRFLSPKMLAKSRGDLRRLMRTKAEMESAALSALKDAGQYHFSLERIYGDAMDFSKKEDLTEKLRERILSLMDTDGN